MRRLGNLGRRGEFDAGAVDGPNGNGEALGRRLTEPGGLLITNPLFESTGPKKK